VTTCCEITSDIPDRQRRVLSVVLGLNAAMFVAEGVAGLLAHSTALLADSADMLGDAIVYGFSLYAVGRGARWQGRAALLKGGIMAFLGLGVLGEAGVKLAQGMVPTAPLMGGIGLLALAVNTCVLLFLWRHRGDDVNMRSAWLCSRNDVIANLGVLLAAWGVALTGTSWPDVIVGLSIAILFSLSAVQVIGAAARQLRQAATSP